MLPKLSKSKLVKEPENTDLEKFLEINPILCGDSKTPLNDTSISKGLQEVDTSLLNKKQKEAFQAIVQGKNIFLTGGSGTGKSTLVHLFKKTYDKNKTIAITSTTGISALLVGGTTIHSYAGIGLGNGIAEDLAEVIMKKHYLRKRWNDLDTLIIDEVSMLSPELLDKLDYIAKTVRRGPVSLKHPKSDLPFGGIQLILTGDFLQLPVVGSDDFCFESNSWPEIIDKVYYLTEIIRQPDPEFQDILNELRFGKVSKKGRKLLKSRIGVELYNDLGILPTRIHTTNYAVDTINENELDKLATEGAKSGGSTDFFEYEMEIYFHEFVQNREQALERTKKNCLAPAKLQLCLKAQVMLLYNLDLPEGLANGSRGVVIGFMNDLPIVRFLNGVERIIDYHTWTTEEGKKKQVSITQLPLKLAWCVTVHKSQGATLDYASIDLSNVFEYGQAYVALSRVKNKEGLSIIDVDFEKIRAHPKAVDFYRKLEESKE